jgi:hypothetical protein
MQTKKRASTGPVAQGPRSRESPYGTRRWPHCRVIRMLEDGIEGLSAPISRRTFWGYGIEDRIETFCRVRP